MKHLMQLRNFFEAINPLLLISFLGWAVLTIIINILDGFLPVYDYLDNFVFAVVAIDVLVVAMTLFLQRRFIVKFKAMQDFFTFHRAVFMHAHNSIQDPEAQKAFKTHIGRFIDWNHRRLQTLSMPHLQRMQENHKMMLVILTLLATIAIVGVKFKIFLAAVSDSLAKSGAIIIDLGLIIIPASIVIWLIAYAQYNQWRSINNWYLNILEYFNLRSRKYFSDDKEYFFGITEELHAKQDILEYFAVPDVPELRQSILDFKAPATK